MRQFTEENLTEAVVARLKDVKNPRFKQLMTSAIRHLHAFAREVQLTEEEWFEGIKFLTAVGQKCDEKRQEFILLSDVLGVSMMVVALNHKTAPGATEATVLGPFFAHGAPEFELRGRVKANAKGEYAFKSYKPKFYGVPTDGPVGDLLRAMSRHPMRPAHMHAIVSAPGYEQVITHVFVEGDPYLDSDAVFAVKDSLIASYRKVDSPEEAKKLGMPNPFLKLEWNFHLAPDTGVKARKTIAPSDAIA